MTDFPSNIARKAIADFAAYSARGASTSALHLDANESPYAPPPVNATKDYNRYPAQQPAALRARLADLYGTTAERIMIGRGADEAIDILLRTFCEAGRDNVLITSPTFGFFKVAAQIQGAGVIDVPLLGDLSWDTEAIVKTATAADNLKLIFLCSPNNPTGNCIEDDLVEQLCAALPNTLIVIDEAYGEFTKRDSYVTEQAKFHNLVVTRTLSKAYALAGVRGGVAIADPAIIELMLKVLPPYPVARPVEQAIMAALSPSAMAVHAARLDEILAERERVANALASSPFIADIYPSEANFILLKVKDTERMLVELSKRHVKIRDMRSKLSDTFRLTIGSPTENNIALAAFGLDMPTARPDRVGEEHRLTKETDISVRVNLDDPSVIKVDTGIGFYDHMLEALAKHGKFGLTMACQGDLHIDAHHTIEDCALALGTALKSALGNKAGIGRFGFVMPMDETQARVAVDLSGRPAMTFKGEFPTDHAGTFPAEMCPHVFESIAQTLGAAIQIDVQGENTHHMIEASFKGVAKCFAAAFARDGDDIPSTKGVI